MLTFPSMHQIHHTKVPFGLSMATPFLVETNEDEFRLELRDCNGAPILSLVMDTDNGEIYVKMTGWKIADSYLIDFIADKNRAKITRAENASAEKS
jgi:hypothetical protein